MTAPGSAAPAPPGPAPSVRPGCFHPRAGDIAQFNKRRSAFVRAVAADLARIAGVSPAGPATALAALMRETDPYEFDFAFPADAAGTPRLEIGYNPHLRLSGALRDRAAALAHAAGIDLGPLDALWARFTPQWAETTVGVEWTPAGAPKLSLFLENLCLERDADLIWREALAAAADLGVDAAASASIRHRPPAIIAVDARERVEAMRILVAYPADGLDAAAAEVRARAGSAAAAAIDRVAALFAGSPADHYLVYHKYEPGRGLTQVKLYKTPPYVPPAAEAVTGRSAAGVAVGGGGVPSPARFDAATVMAECKALPAAMGFGLEHGSLRLMNALERAAAEADVALEPACLSAAFPLGRPEAAYAVSYISVGELPLRFM